MRSLAEDEFGHRCTSNAACRPVFTTRRITNATDSFRLIKSRPKPSLREMSGRMSGLAVTFRIIAGTGLPLMAEAAYQQQLKAKKWNTALLDSERAPFASPMKLISNGSRIGSGSRGSKKGYRRFVDSHLASGDVSRWVTRPGAWSHLCEIHICVPVG